MSEKESEIFNVYRELEGIPAAPRGVALGVFDGVHRGHRHLIARMKEACAERHLRPCVFTFSYDTGFGFNDKKINHDFLMTDAEKLEVLESLGMRDVFLIPLTPDFCRLSADAFLSDVLMNKLSVKLLAIGEDGRFGAGRRGDARYLREFSRSRDLESLIVPDLYWEGAKVTSSRIREALLEGCVEDASGMMERPYRLSGVVVSGSHLGSRIGFPTANIEFPSTSSLLRRGVYVTRTIINGKVYPSISNVGVAPSVRETGSEMLIETYLYDYIGDLYGRDIIIEFYAFIRDESVFPSVRDLAACVHADIDAVRIWHLTHETT